jgi:hypothetical protein
MKLLADGSFLNSPVPKETSEDVRTAYKGLLVASGSDPAFVTRSEFRSSPLMHIRVTGPRKANYVKHYSNSVLQVLIKRFSNRSARIEMIATAKLVNRP